eukprot:11402959-Prorocentrum_lima.AAC.1
MKRVVCPRAPSKGSPWLSTSFWNEVAPAWSMDMGVLIRESSPVPSAVLPRSLSTMMGNSCLFSMC